MVISGIQQLSEQAIEEKSEHLLKLCRKDHLDYSLPLPYHKILEVLTTNKVSYDFDRSLGFSDTGDKIIGATNLKKRIILIDKSLKTDPHRFYYTFAHELGHLALHRNLKFDRLGISPYVQLKNDYKVLEWQADVYAEALLVPGKILATTLKVKQREMNRPETGRIYLDHQGTNQTDYLLLVKKLCDFFSVDRALIEKRLRKFELVEDPMESVQRIDALLVQQVLRIESQGHASTDTDIDSPF